MKRKLFWVGLSLMLVLSLLISLAAPITATNAQDDLYDLPYACFRAYMYKNHFEEAFVQPGTSYANIYLSSMEQDGEVKEGIENWRKVHLCTDLGGALTGDLLINEKHLYSLAIFDMLDIAYDSDYVRENHTANLNRYKLELSTIAVEEKINLDYIVDPEEFSIFKEKTSATAYSSLVWALGALEDGMATYKEVINYASKYLMLNDFNESTQRILYAISMDENNPMALRVAANECANHFNMSPDDIKKEALKDATVGIIAKTYLSFCWTALQGTLPFFGMLNTAAAGMRILLDTYFNMSNICRAYHSLKSTVDLENAMSRLIHNYSCDFLNEENTEQALYYMEMIELFQNVVLDGFDRSFELMEKEYESPSFVISNLLSNIPDLSTGKSAKELCQEAKINLNRSKLEKMKLYQDFETLTKKNYTSSIISIGEEISLGKYLGEEIKWICVHIDENGPLMMSKDILCQKEYDAAGVDGFYHTDGWGWVREQAGSNCWYDSNIRQWLNSVGTVKYTHCPPSYAEEDGFLSGFTSSELKLIKRVTQKAYLNEWETTREDYVDGGSAEIPDVYELSKLNFDYVQNSYLYQNVTDMIFFLNQEQIYSIYLSNPGCLSAETDYWTRIARTTGASYNNVGTLYDENGSGTKIACDSAGVRPAFYLNIDDYVIQDTIGNNQIEVFSEIYDISATGSDNVKAWLRNDPNNSGYYDLSIEGTGSMLDWAFDDAPWYLYGKKIKTVTIENGVTNIGYRAFANCTSLTSISVPDSVQIIDECAFQGCHSLSKVDLGKGIKKIGKNAFDDCFSLLNISVDESNQYYCAIDGNMYSRDKRILEQYAIGKKNESFTIPTFVTTIGDRALADATNLTTVIIPDNVTEIEEWAFYLCKKLTTVSIGNGVLSIGDLAFYNCIAITSVKLGNNITSIGDNAFYNCNALTKIIIPSSVTIIGDNAFGYCSNLNIYPEVEKQPIGWSSSWNSSNRPVIWASFDEKVRLEQIFSFKGYSFGPNGSMAVGYDIDYEAKALYEELTGVTLDIGVVFAGFDNLSGNQPLDASGNAIALQVGKVVKANLTNFDYTSYDFMLTDIDDSIKDVKLVIAAYIYDGENAKYVQENGISDTVCGISYSEAKVGIE